MTDIWDKRFEMIRFLGWIAVAGLVTGVAALIAKGELRTFLAVVFGGLLMPLFLYVYVAVIWHWKARYRGHHSDLWGALILLETSGWFKLIYIFRHLIPDMRRRGIYRPEFGRGDAAQLPDAGIPASPE